MVCEAARQLRDGEVVFVGIGLRISLVILLGGYMHKAGPGLRVWRDWCRSKRLPISTALIAPVSDSSLSVCSMFDVFTYYLQGGLIDVGFLQGSQIDRFGNLNTTVVGDYRQPKVRLPGSGGACEIAIHAKRVLVIGPQSKRSFPERVDFITSPGFVDGPSTRKELGMPGAGTELVITNFGCYEFVDGEMVLKSLHPGCTLEQVRENTAGKSAFLRT